MWGWVAAGAFYALGVLVVFRASNDPIHRLMAPIWPLTLVYLLLTLKEI